MEHEYQIECEECDSVTVVLVENGEKPEFCPVCGRRAEAENLKYESSDM